RDPRVALGVEELGREQGAAEVLGRDGDAANVRGTAPRAVDERRVQVPESALEERDAAVSHRVRDARVGRVQEPGPGGDRLLGECRGHCPVLLLRYNYLRSQ